MKNGKVSESVLKRSVLKQVHNKEAGMLQKPGPGADFGALVVPEGETALVSAVSTETLYTSDMAMRCVLRALNHVAVSGAKPILVSISLTVPTIWNEAQLRELMRDVGAVCASHEIPVSGGHTQAARGVKEPVLTVTAMGTAPKKNLLTAGGIRPGMELLLTKYIAMEGTSLLAKEKRAELSTRFAQPFLDRAAKYGEYMEIMSEAAVAMGAGAAAMHCVSEGGIFGALWEMAEASGIGMEIDLKKIPIRQETVEITEFFDINPYKLISGGALLIACADGAQMVRALEEAGIPAAIIGIATDSNDRVLYKQEERRFLETVQTDEIYSVFGA